MKHNRTKILIIAIILICTTSVCAQFNSGGGGIGNRWGETNNPNANNTIRRVGIGDFSGFTSAPASAFHINANFLTAVSPFALNTFLPGEVFRTTGPSTNVNAWRMFTGTGNGTERFSITTPANSDDALISTVQNGAMRFNTNGIQRMLINGL
ncbi:MAG: hypothetical protein COA97_08050 [Flavobacteriales bacterium]|nr:MAG: hypothetical protein COA97_08050 [Flavobacteriales bacterium]